MKKVLIISEHYWPYVSANVNCAKKIIDGLKERGFSVSVMTVAFEEALKDVETVNDVTIYRVKVTEYSKVDKKYATNDTDNIILKILKFLIRGFLYAYIRHLKYYKAKKLSEKLKEENFDCVISVVNPIFTHHYAYNMVDKRNKWIMYYLDPYVYNYIDTKHRGKKKHVEKRWCRKAAAVINSDGIREENERHLYFPYKNMKQLDIPLPNFELGAPAEKVSGGNEKIVMRYTGRFYSDIRRPEELLKIIGKLDPEKFQAEFYGESCEYIRSNYSDIPECLRLMGDVSVEKCKEIVNTSDVLINVGNTCPNQVPSKVFEYISSGKPILNIYMTDNDPSMKYLKKYPRIINTSNGDTVSEKDILELVATPEIDNDNLREIYREELSESVIDRVAEFIDNL